MKMNTKMILYMTILIIIPMTAISYIINMVYQNVLTQKINSISQQTLLQISNNIDTLINNIIASSNIIAQDQEIIELLSKEGDMAIEDEYIISRKLVQAQSSVLYAYNTEMIIYDNHDRYYTLSYASSMQNIDEVKSQQWYLDTLAGDGFMNWCSPDMQNLNFSDYSLGNICMARVLKDKNHKNAYGVLLISVYPTGRLEYLLKDIDESSLGDFYVVNTEGNIIMSSKPDLSGKPLSEVGIHLEDLSGERQNLTLDVADQKMIVNYYTNSKSSFKIIQAIPQKIMLKEVYLMKKVILGVNVLSFIFFLGCCIWMSYTFTNPLKDLCQSMKQVGKGDFSGKISINSYGEWKVVTDRYNTMIEEINRLMKELEQSYFQREELRYKSLQSQINPHFILNTLNGIKILAQMDNADQAAEMVISLGNMLEHILNRKDEMIELQDEIVCIENYCQIQKMRYGDIFTLTCEIPEDLMHIKIPCLLLQPLIENAIVHGIHDAVCYGEVKIRAFFRSEDLVIEIRDNGIGMTKEQIDQVFHTDQGKVTGIGVKNVDERIRLIFGEKSGIHIVSEPGVGTSVEVILEHAQMPGKNEYHKQMDSGVEI